jgi:hypothetical protein
MMAVIAKGPCGDRYKAGWDRLDDSVPEPRVERSETKNEVSTKNQVRLGCNEVSTKNQVSPRSEPSEDGQRQAPKR